MSLLSECVYACACVCFSLWVHFFYFLFFCFCCCSHTFRFDFHLIRIFISFSTFSFGSALNCWSICSRLIRNNIRLLMCWWWILCSPLLHERQKSKIAKLKQQKKLFLRSRPSKSNNTIAFCDLYFFSSLYSVAVLRSYSSRTILFCHALSLCLFETTTHTYQPHTTNALTRYSARGREHLIADMHAEPSARESVRVVCVCIGAVNLWLVVCDCRLSERARENVAPFALCVFVCSC